MEFDDLPREKLKGLIFQETENFHMRYNSHIGAIHDDTSVNEN